MGMLKKKISNDVAANKKPTGVKPVSKVPTVKAIKPVSPIKPIRRVKSIAPIGYAYYWND
jgi:hypothetical protein